MPTEEEKRKKTSGLRRYIPIPGIGPGVLLPPGVTFRDIGRGFGSAINTAKDIKRSVGEGLSESLDEFDAGYSDVRGRKTVAQDGEFVGPPTPKLGQNVQKVQGGEGGLGNAGANQSGGEVDPDSEPDSGSRKQIGDGGRLRIPEVDKRIYGNSAIYTERGTGKVGTATFPERQGEYTGTDVAGNVFGNGERLGGTVSVLDFSGFRGENYNPEDYAENPAFAAVNRRYASEVSGAREQQAEIDRGIGERVARREAEKANRPLVRLLADLRGNESRFALDAKAKLGELIAQNNAAYAQRVGSGDRVGNEGASISDFIAAQKLGLDERKSLLDTQLKQAELGLKVSGDKRDENRYLYDLQKGERSYDLDRAKFQREILKEIGDVLADDKFQVLKPEQQKARLIDLLRQRGVPEENLEDELKRYLG